MVKDDEKLYFEWLVERIKGKYYEELLEKLYSLPFVVDEHDRDHSRMVDGAKLREDYKKSNRRLVASGRVAFPREACTFLEMLIALAYRLDDDVMYEVKFGDRTVDWFWIFIENMQMSDATNEHWNLHWDRYVTNRYRKIMKHTYGRDGSGGMFIVKERPDDDMRDIDIWRQMMWWCSESLRNGKIV